MSLKVDFEHFDKGEWQHMRLKDSDRDFWREISVGDQYFKLVGTQRQIAKWL